jgi:hypothetical protein
MRFRHALHHTKPNDPVEFKYAFTEIGSKGLYVIKPQDENRLAKHKLCIEGVLPDDIKNLNCLVLVIQDNTGEYWLLHDNYMVASVEVNRIDITTDSRLYRLSDEAFGQLKKAMK